MVEKERPGAAEYRASSALAPSPLDYLLTMHDNCIALTLATTLR
jgi:hypothetical protein